jgi:hypothetical protein
MSNDFDLLNEYSLDELNTLSLDELNDISIPLTDKCYLKRLPQFIIDILTENLININNLNLKDLTLQEIFDLLLSQIDTLCINPTGSDRWQDYNCLYKKWYMLNSFSNDPSFMLCSSDVPAMPDPTLFTDLISPKSVPYCGQTDKE